MAIHGVGRRRTIAKNEIKKKINGRSITNAPFLYPCLWPPSVNASPPSRGTGKLMKVDRTLISAKRYKTKKKADNKFQCM
ncbi:hypothetical protein VTO42DRAFT_3306 [Malbranchea cinnamomea]